MKDFWEDVAEMKVGDEVRVIVDKPVHGYVTAKDDAKQQMTIGTLTGPVVVTFTNKPKEAPDGTTEPEK